MKKKVSLLLSLLLLVVFSALTVYCNSRIDNGLIYRAGVWVSLVFSGVSILLISYTILYLPSKR